jgi:prepilin-type N-terminal cleavage/methylation domain-containing protein
MEKKNGKNTRGFSLIEMLVSMFIMVTIVMAVTAVFAKSYSARKAAREAQTNLEEARTAIEAIAKNMRMSSHTREDGTGKTLTMLNNSQGICLKYRFFTDSTGQKKLSQSSRLPSGAADDCSAGAYGAEGEMISKTVDGGFHIIETDRTAGSERVGRGTIWIKMGTQTLQTTVSFRDYQGVL